MSLLINDLAYFVRIAAFSSGRVICRDGDIISAHGKIIQRVARDIADIYAVGVIPR